MGQATSAWTPATSRRTRRRGYGYAWSGLNGLFRRDDLTVVNVECPVTDAGPQLVKGFSFYGTPDALLAMRDAGVEVGSLANNHGYDHGPAGLVDSRKNLEAAGIPAVGAGKDQDQALQTAVFQAGDRRPWPRSRSPRTGRVVGKILPAFITAPGHPELR